MTLCGCPLLRSLLGVKRTCRFALQMSAYDPKRTSVEQQIGGTARWLITLNRKSVELVLLVVDVLRGLLILG